MSPFGKSVRPIDPWKITSPIMQHCLWLMKPHLVCGRDNEQHQMLQWQLQPYRRHPAIDGTKVSTFWTQTSQQPRGPSIQNKSSLWGPIIGRDNSFASWIPPQDPNDHAYNIILAWYHSRSESCEWGLNRHRINYAPAISFRWPENRAILLQRSHRNNLVAKHMVLNSIF